MKMSRIYLIVTLCLFTFLACTNSANSNDQEEADNTDKSVNLHNAVGRYQHLSDGIAKYSSCGWANSIEIFELGNNIYRCFVGWNGVPLHGRDPSACRMTFDLDKIENGKWLSNEDGWYIVIPQDGFSKDLSSIVIAYEDSTGQVEAYPFDKVK
jgi:hypothetical protein